MNNPYKILYFVAVAILFLVSFASIVRGAQPEFVTICHVAGLADEPANYVTLTLPSQAVYGQAGHFNENGTTQAGHEEDYLGACIEDPSDTPDPSVSPTPAPSFVICPGVEVQIPEQTGCPSPSIAPSADPDPSVDPTPTPAPRLIPPETATNTPSVDVPDTAMEGPYSVR